MSWGGRANIPRMNYEKCVAAVAAARNRAAGKPMGTIRIFDRGTHYAVQQYRTDIVRYYKDGSIEIYTGWTSISTLSAIGNLTGKWVGNTRLPLFNDRKPAPERLHMIDGAVFNSRSGYLRFGPDGKLDLATVEPYKVDTISCKKAVAVARRKARQLANQVLLRAKLGIRSHGHSEFWLRSNLDVPLAEVDYSNAPQAVDLSGGPMRFARLIGAIKPVQFKEFT